jgi:hypothetical protein
MRANSAFCLLLLVSCLAYSSDLEDVGEMFPEEHTLHSQHCADVKSSSVRNVVGYMTCLICFVRMSGIYYIKSGLL